MWQNPLLGVWKQKKQHVSCCSWMNVSFDHLQMTEISHVMGWQKIRSVSDLVFRWHVERKIQWKIKLHAAIFFCQSANNERNILLTKKFDAQKIKLHATVFVKLPKNLLYVLYKMTCVHALSFPIPVGRTACWLWWMYWLDKQSIVDLDLLFVTVSPLCLKRELKHVYWLDDQNQISTKTSWVSKVRQCWRIDRGVSKKVYRFVN